VLLFLGLSRFETSSFDLLFGMELYLCDRIRCGFVAELLNFRSNCFRLGSGVVKLNFIFIWSRSMDSIDMLCIVPMVVGGI